MSCGAKFFYNNFGRKYERFQFEVYMKPISEELKSRDQTLMLHQVSCCSFSFCAASCVFILASCAVVCVSNCKLSKFIQGSAGTV